MHDSKRHCADPEEDSLTVYQTYRTTPESAAKVKEHARLAGISISALTRQRVDGHLPPTAAAPLLNLGLAAELRATTSNLNQMTKHLNTQVLSGQAAIVEMAQLKALILKMDHQVAALRADLMGAGGGS